MVTELVVVVVVVVEWGLLIAWIVCVVCLRLRARSRIWASRLLFCGETLLWIFPRPVRIIGAVVDVAVVVVLVKVEVVVVFAVEVGGCERCLLRGAMKSVRQD